MESPPPAAVDDLSLVDALARAWAIEVDGVRYVPKGFGSYHWTAHGEDRPTHFLTVDDLDTKPWIARDRDDAFDGLTAAYATAWALRHEDGLESVVAPLRAEDGAVALRLDDRFSLAVFPFVDGRAGTWREPLDTEGRTQLVQVLARLHAASGGSSPRIRTRPHELPERAELLSALDGLDRPWTGGELSEPSRRALADNEGLVRERLARFDALAAQLDASDGERVVTHGEPHPGNLLHGPDGLRLIDWDTVALAEPERDAWMLDDAGDEALGAYAETTGRTIDPVAIECYRLAWTLSDIASFADMFRSAHEGSGWLEEKWAGWVGLVEGASSTPYGART